MHPSAQAQEEVRLAVYTAFADTGRAPSIAQLAAAASLPEDDVAAILVALAASRHLVLDEHGTIVMAHPFSAVPMGFSVMGRRTLWWGGCSWDAFAIPHLVPADPEVLVATRCPACDAPHAWVVGREAPPHGAQLARFMIPVEHMWDDVLRTCAHQRIFCGPACLDDLVARTGEPRGDAIDIPTLWRLAAGWYDGRLDADYTRREPAEAAGYLRAAGLRGDFWGLGDDTPG